LSFQSTFPRTVRLGAPGEIASGVRDILAVTDLPALVDVDNGYGDVWADLENRYDKDDQSPSEPRP
jgi:hypothetical protein